MRIVQYDDDGVVSPILCAWRHYSTVEDGWTVDTMLAIESLASESDVFVGVFVGTVVG